MNNLPIDFYFQEDKQNNFNALRLLASIFVIYGHSFPIVGSVERDFFLEYFHYKFIGGLAVDIFFVISGFLVAHSYLINSKKYFILSRILRIFPGLVVCILITTFLLGPLLTTSNNYFNNNLTWKYFYNNSFLITTEYYLPGVFTSLPNAAVNGSLWSLPLEFRLYIAVFLCGTFSLLKSIRFNLIFFVLIIYLSFNIGKFPILVQYENWVNSSFLFFIGVFYYLNRKLIRLNFLIFLTLIIFNLLFVDTVYFKYIYIL